MNKASRTVRSWIDAQLNYRSREELGGWRPVRFDGQLNAQLHDRLWGRLDASLGKLSVQLSHGVCKRRRKGSRK